MAKKNKNESPEKENDELIPENNTAAAADEKAAQKEPEKAEEKENPFEKQFTEEHDKYLRLAAEYDNYRKRSTKERDAMFVDVRSDTILKLLPVYDNLSRALRHETTDEAFYKGVEMTMTQLKEIFEKLGVKEIPAVGEKFDPNMHNAVMHIDDEKYGDGEIVEEFEKGFTMGDKVIRFSTVKVAN